MPTRFLLTALVAFVVATSGCDTTLPSNTTGTTSTATDNTTSGSDSPNNGSEVTQPTAQEVGEATKHALEIVGWTIASVRPVTEMQGYLEGTVALPTCPTIVADIAANTLNLAFDFGQGCAPSPYVSPAVGGRVSGSSVPSLRSFELGDIALEIEGAALTGAEYGGYSTADGITTIAMTVNLVADGGFTVSGPVTIELDPATGDYAFTEASLTFSTDGLGTWTADYFRATVTPASSGSFRAVSGTAIATSNADPTVNEPSVVDVTLAD